MSAEDQDTSELVLPGSGVYKITGEGQQYGTVNLDLPNFGFNNSFDFERQRINEALRTLSGADYGGAFGLPVVPSPTTITGIRGSQTEENIEEEPADLLELEEIEDFSTGLENDLEQVDMLDPSLVPVDEDAAEAAKAAMESEWEEVDKDADFGTILDEAMRIFGAYDRNAISKVVDVVNDRGMSVGEVAIATGNTIESINQAAAESGTAIENQGLVPPEPPTPDPEPPVDPKIPAEPPTPEPPVDPEPPQDTQPPADPEIPAEPTVVMDRPADPTVVMDTPVTPEPTLTSFMPDLPKQQQTNITLLQNIMNETPITESILFPTEFTKLENVQQGMFEKFLSAAGGNQ